MAPATVQIEENDKETTAAQTAVFRTNGGSLETFRINLNKSSGTVFTMIDGALVNTHQTLSNSIDATDAGKFFNFNESISVINGSKFLAIEGRQLYDNGDTLRIALHGMQQTSYELDLQPGNINVAGITAVLHDNYLNTTQPVSLTANTVYPFTVNGSATSGNSSRFFIVFTNTSPLDVRFITVTGRTEDKKNAVDWTVGSESSVTRYDVERSADGKEFAGIGSITAENRDAYSWTDETPLNRISYYRIKAVARSNKSIYSKVVKIGMGETARQIIVYPNPATSNSLQLHLSGIAKGIYSMNITNVTGQTMMTQQVNVDGTTIINVDISKLTPGTYIINVLDEAGQVVSDQKMIRQ